MIRFGISFSCLFSFGESVTTDRLLSLLKVASEPAGAPGGATLLPTAAGEGGRAHGGEEPAELRGHQHIPSVRDRTEHGGRGAGAREGAGADTLSLWHVRLPRDHRGRPRTAGACPSFLGHRAYHFSFLPARTCGVHLRKPRPTGRAIRK